MVSAPIRPLGVRKRALEADCAFSHYYLPHPVGRPGHRADGSTIPRRPSASCVGIFIHGSSLGVHSS